MVFWHLPFFYFYIFSCKTVVKKGIHHLLLASLGITGHKHSS